LYWQSLAQKLGTTVDKLQQATTDARKDALDQAVKQGLLTQAQADRMSQRARGVAALASVATARLDAAAKTLGMSTSDLTTALRGGKTLLDLAREKNVDATKLRTAIADAENLARHADIAAMRDLDEEEPLEVEASKYDLNYIKLDGDIGCMVNGAGLAMGTMDIIKHYGGAPANFLDVGGGASQERVENAFRILLSDPGVKAVLIGETFMRAKDIGAKVRELLGVGDYAI
jgi:hypothetical protein